MNKPCTPEMNIANNYDVNFDNTAGALGYTEVLNDSDNALNCLDAFDNAASIIY